MHGLGRVLPCTPAPQLPWAGWCRACLAQIWASKWTYVSPVWLQLRVEGGKPVVTGLHDVDPGWMEALRAPCQRGFECPLIVPR